LAGTGCFNGSVESKQVGLLGKIVDDLNDFADVVRTRSQGVDDFARGADGGVNPIQAVGGLLHRGDTTMDFFTRTVRDVEKDAGGVGDTLDGSNHLINRGGCFADAGSLHLGVLHHVLHVDAHLVHGAGHFIDRGGGLQTDFGGLIRRAGDLGGATGDLGAPVAHVADDS